MSKTNFQIDFILLHTQASVKKRFLTRTFSFSGLSFAGRSRQAISVHVPSSCQESGVGRQQVQRIERWNLQAGVRPSKTPRPTPTPSHIAGCQGWNRRYSRESASHWKHQRDVKIEIF